MKALNNLKITLKLPLLIALLVAVAVGLFGESVNRFQSEGLIEETKQRVEAVVDAQSVQIQEYFRSIGRDLDNMVADNRTSRAISQFERGWNLMGETVTADLQKLYIEDNPHPLGERQKYERANDPSIYSSTHGEFHRLFLARLQKLAYYDIFLFDTQGNLLYSVVKENDFATNMITGPWKDSGLARAYRGAMQAKDGEQVFVDYEAYAPSFGAAAAFLAQPVLLFGKPIGVVAVQLPDNEINAIVEDRAGLGRTADFFLVGPDYLLRSNRAGMDEPTILTETFSAPAADAAFAGEKGIELVENAAGIPVIRAYHSLDVFGLTWAVIADIHQAEALASISRMRLMLVIGSLIAIGGATLAGFVISATLSRPLRRVNGAVSKISEGALATQVPDTDRRDEIGQIAARLEEFRGKLIAAEAERVESAFRGAAFSASTAAIMMLNSERRILHANKAVVALLRAHPADFAAVQPVLDGAGLAGQDIDAVFPADVVAAIAGALDDPDRLPRRVTAPVGDIRLLVEIGAVADDAGAPLGFVVEIKDVTEEFLNRAILDSIDGYQVRAEIAVDRRMLEVNAAFCTLVGHARETIVGQPPERFIRFEEPETALEALRTGTPLFGRFVLPRASGDEAIVEGGVTAVKDDDGAILRYVLIATDISESQRALAEAETERRARAAAQAQVVDTLRSSLGKLAGGDLTARIDTAFDADYEQLRSDFNEAVLRLLEAMRGVAQNAQEIRGGAAEISSAADDLSTRTERQAATLEETAAALDQLTASVRVAAEGASKANRIVEDARANAETSGEVVRGAVQAMSELEKSSKQISKITEVIDDISYQTNLLALNAGVEAARAGEAGRGFAVVASEVRALAQRSSDAAREINELITSSGRQVKEGVDLVGQAGDALKGIVDGVVEISGHVARIAASSSEQSEGLAEINVAVGQLDEVTQQNAAMFQETAAAGHSLTREAEALTEAIARFRTRTDDPAANVVAPPFRATARAGHRQATQAGAGGDSAAPAPAAAPGKSRRYGGATAAAQAEEPDFEDDAGWRDF